MLQGFQKCNIHAQKTNGIDIIKLYVTIQVHEIYEYIVIQSRFHSESCSSDTPIIAYSNLEVISFHMMCDLYQQMVI